MYRFHQTWSVFMFTALAACSFGPEEPPLEEASQGDEADADADVRFVRVSRDGQVSSISLGQRREALRLAGLVPIRGAAAPGWRGIEPPIASAFGPIEPEDDPLAYPTSATVRLSFPDSGDGGTGRCSGILVAPSVVVTSAHCVVSGNTGTLYGLPEVAAVPSGTYDPFGEDVGPFGRAEAYQIDYPEDYSGSPGDTVDDITGAELDVAIVWLDRPIGALSGWVSYAADTCDSLTSEEYVTTAYPAEGGHNGAMHTFEGTFHDCPNGHAVRAIDTTVYGGMSGGATYRSVGGQPTAVAAWSGGSNNNTYAARYYPTFVSWLDTVIAEVGAANSLYALELRTGTDEVAPELDGTVDDVSFKLARFGNTAFSGTLTADFYLVPAGHLSSNDDAVIAAGTHVGSYEFDADLAGNETATIDVPDGVVDVPASLTPVAEVERELAVVLSGAFDPQPYNNPAIGILTENFGLDGYTYSAGLWDRAPLTLTNPSSDLEPTELVVHNADLGLGLVGPLQVTFGMQNAGPGVTGEISVEFYLSRTQAYVPASSPDLIKIHEGGHPGLAPGAQYSTGLLLAIPPEAVGEYFLLAHATGAQPEGDIDDQWIATDRSFLVSQATGQLTGAPPNLNVDYVGLTDGATARSVPVAFSITNIGGSVADTWDAAFYARPVSGVGPEVFIASGSDVALAPGASSAHVVALPISGVPVGRWRVVLRVVDADDPISANNVGVTVGTFERKPGLAF